MSAVDELLDISARIGADPALVQGPGGNISLKTDDGTLLIKASGTWLAHAREKPVLVPIRLAPLQAAIGRDDPETETCVAFVDAAANPLGLRPSIETTLHAVLPQRVVLHVHCVETIAWAARRDAPTALAAPLAGLAWAYAPYARPGRPLTRAVRAALRPGVDVLILGNHGLVVAGETVAEAQALLADVCGRLRQAPRPAPEPDRAALAKAAAGSAYAPAEDDAMHGLATDPASFAIATSGSYYPDHVIFLGPVAIALPPGAQPDAMAQRLGRPSLPMLLVEGAGVLLRRDATAGAVALARCLADVTARIAPGTVLRALSPDEEHALTNWDAEKYRQALDKAS